MLRRVMKALSLGDGEGRNGVWLADQGLDVLPVDFSAPAQAKAHYHKPTGTSDKGRCGEAHSRHPGIERIVRDPAGAN